MSNEDSKILYLPKPRRKLTDREKLDFIKSELNSSIEERLERLQIQAARISRGVEMAKNRVVADGLLAKIEPIGTGTWYRVSTQIETLQQLVKFLESLEDEEI